MLFSKTCNYAIRALVYLTEHREDGPILSSVIAREEDIPAPFLSKILGTLATVKIVDSTRGRKGGFILTADPEKISLLDIADLFDHYSSSSGCLLGYGGCSDGDPCPLHKYWSKPKRLINEFLTNTTLSQLSKIIPKEQRESIMNKGTRLNLDIDTGKD